MDDAFYGLGPLGAYADEDLRAWVVAGSRPRRFDDALSALARARLLSSAVGASYGPAVERGMAAEEAGAALALAGHGAGDWGQLRAKRLALRPYASEGPSCLLGAVVRAALAHDERRLGSEARPMRRARGCPGSGHAGSRDVAVLPPSPPGPSGGARPAPPRSPPRRPGRVGITPQGDAHASGIRAGAPSASRSTVPAPSNARRSAASREAPTSLQPS